MRKCPASAREGKQGKNLNEQTKPNSTKNCLDVIALENVEPWTRHHT